MKKLSNREMRRRNMILLFLDSTLEIINQEGVSKVTIRKVADKAGYNSATLYTYFDNLNHLLFFASMTSINEYIKDIPNYIKNIENPCEMYIRVWDCYIDNCYKKIDTFYYLFFSPLSKNAEKWAQEYYELFPIEADGLPEDIQNMLNTPYLNKRSFHLIKPCIDKGYMSEKDAEDINSIVISISSGFLAEVRSNSIDKNYAYERSKYLIRRVFEAIGGYNVQLEE